MRDYRQLLIWQKSHLFTLNVHTVTQSFPRSEIYGLVNQLRRSSSSIPTNIAEGCGRNTNADFTRFLNIAMGSANEADYQLLLAKDLGYLTLDEYDRLALDIIELRRMLSSFIRKARSLPDHKPLVLSP